MLLPLAGRVGPTGAPVPPGSPSNWRPGSNPRRHDVALECSWRSRESRIDHPEPDDPGLGGLLQPETVLPDRSLRASEDLVDAQTQRQEQRVADGLHQVRFARHPAALRLEPVMSPPGAGRPPAGAAAPARRAACRAHLGFDGIQRLDPGQRLGGQGRGARGGCRRTSSSRGPSRRPRRSPRPRRARRTRVGVRLQDPLKGRGGLGVEPLRFSE